MYMILLYKFIKCFKKPMILKNLKAIYGNEKYNKYFSYFLFLKKNYNNWFKSLLVYLIGYTI